MNPPTEAGASTSLTKIGTISQCGVTPVSLSYNIKGQQVAWSLTSPTPLARGWVVKFVASTSANGFFTVTPVTGAVTTDCGGTVITAAGDFTVYDTSANAIIFPIATVSPTNGLDTFAPACAGASKFTATVNNWKGSGAATAIAAGNCVITLSGSTLKTGVVGGVDELGAVSMSGGLAFD